MGNMSSKKRKIQIGQETAGYDEKLVLTIEIPKAYAGEYKANQEKVTQAATKAVLDIIGAQEIGDEKELDVTIKIPKAYADEYKANQEKVTQAATKAVLDIIGAQDPLHRFWSGAKEPFGDQNVRRISVPRSIINQLQNLCLQYKTWQTFL